MKRNENLQPLSRQHHNGLLMGLLLDKGLKRHADIFVMAEFILDCWQKDLSEHFQLEENVLLPVLKRKCFDKELIARLLKDHSAVRFLVNKLASRSITEKDIKEFASIIQMHIRFEERSFFVEAEKILTDHELREIGLELEKAEISNCINYPVKFWE